MAMNASVMASAVTAAIATLSDEDKSDHSKVWEKICGAIITHIQSNAVITTNVTVTSVSAVQPGAGVSGPGAGSGSGTIA